MISLLLHSTFDKFSSLNLFAKAFATTAATPSFNSRDIFKRHPLILCIFFDKPEAQYNRHFY